MPFVHRRTASSVAKQCEVDWWHGGGEYESACRSEGGSFPRKHGDRTWEWTLERWMKRRAPIGGRADSDGLSDRPKGEDGLLIRYKYCDWLG